MAGIAVGLVAAFYALSFGAILFGPLGAVQHGVVVTLTGALAGVLIGWLGGRPVAVSQVQSVIVIILSLGIADLVRALDPDTDPAVQLATAAALVAISGLATGAALLGVGWLRLGRVSRAIPYPVLGGFLAATGILLIDRAMALGNDGARPGPALPDMAGLLGWVVPVLLGIALALGGRRIGTFAALMGGCIAVAVLFWVAGLAGLIDLGDSRHYLNGTIRSADATLPPVLAARGADFSVWPQMLQTVISVVIVSLLAVLMNLVAIEQAASQPLRIDRQIRATGWGNLIGGALGGAVAYPSPTLNGLGRAFTPRLDGVTLGAMTVTLAVIALGGVTLLGQVPRGPLVFLLSFLGAGFLLRWLWDERRRMPVQDYLIVLLIMAVTILWGVLPAIVIGFAAAAFRFTLAYSRLGLVRAVTTVADRRSSIERPEPESRVLGHHGRLARIYELQGFLFFGSISSPFDRVLADIEDRPGDMECLILDFARVRGMDVSAVRMIARLDEQAHAAGLSVWVTGVDDATEGLLRRGGLDPHTTVLARLDGALVRIEAGILDRFDAEADAYAPILSVLAKARADLGDEFLTDIPFEAGEVLFEQGDATGSLLCIVVGELVAEVGEGRAVASFAPGALVGEIGFLTGSPRTATVRALAGGRAIAIDRAGMVQLRRDHPDIAAILTETLAQIVAQRLTRTTKRLTALEEG